MKMNLHLLITIIAFLSCQDGIKNQITGTWHSSQKETHQPTLNSLRVINEDGTTEKTNPTKNSGKTEILHFFLTW